MKKLPLALATIMVSACQPTAFFSPTGPEMNQTSRKEPIVLYCEPPLPPYVELGALIIRCQDNKCKNLEKYAHRLGANGVIFRPAEEENLYRLFLISRNWPVVGADLKTHAATILKDDRLTCKTAE